MAATKSKQKSADRNVTVKLHGWPFERRMLSVVEACWMVDLEFRTPGENAVKQLTYFQSDDYAKALARYEMIKAIVE